MGLEKLANFDGIVLVDSSSFQRVNGFKENDLINALYYLEDLSLLDQDLILEPIHGTKKGINFLRLPNVYSIPEVGKEMEVFRDKVDKKIEFYKNLERGRKFVPLKSNSAKSKKINNFHNRYSQKLKNIRRNFNFSDKEKTNLNLLNRLSQNLTSLINQIGYKNARLLFSPEETNFYETVSEYIGEECKENNLKIDFGNVYGVLKNRNPCDFETDERLLATGFTFARTRPVKIVGNDSDFRRIMKYMKEKEPDFLKKISHPIHLFSNPVPDKIEYKYALT